MTREEILNRTVSVIYDCIPDLDGTELREDSVINTDAGVDSMGFTLIMCRLEAVLVCRYRIASGRSCKPSATWWTRSKSV